MRHRLASLILSVALVGCGGGGGGTSTGGGGGGAPAFDLTGGWRGTWQSSVNTGIGSIAGPDLTQVGNTLTGFGQIFFGSTLAGGCYNGGNITGKISGTTVVIDWLYGSTVVAVTYTGTATASTITGTYQYQGGVCSNDSGTFALERRT